MDDALAYDVVTDDSGRELLRFVPMQEIAGADFAEPLVGVDDVVPAVLAAMPGWTLSSSDDALIDALVEAGATQTRHSHGYTIDLQDPPPDPAWMQPELPHGVRILSDIPSDILSDGVSLRDQGELSVRAYPHGHADHDGGDPEHAATMLARLYGGRYIGPVLDATGLVLDADRLVGVVIVNRMPGLAPWGGPWVSEIFRDPHPRYARLGAALLRRAMAILASEGESSLSLVVTDGNPARSLYERLGFRYVGSSRKVKLPDLALTR
ncbi:MAG: GNAT family N-acetyltransferase [Actinomycetes bacterium]